jgi:Heavy metal binding domain
MTRFLIVAGFITSFLVACNGQNAAASIKHTDHELYACPMHPDETGKKGDRCPLCGTLMERVDNDAN